MACGIKFRNIVEPILFFYMLSLFLQFPAIQALIYHKICFQNYNATICSHLTNDSYKSEENKVQKESSYWIQYLNLTLLVPSIISVMVLGRIGDAFSRKWTILSPLIGQFLGSLIYLINALNTDLNLTYLLIGPLINGIFGGFTSMLMAIFSYVSHTTDRQYRTVRLGVTESMSFLSGTLGVVLVGVLLDSYGFVIVFGIIFGLSCLALLYAVFIIEDLKPENALTKREIVRQIFCSLSCFRSFIQFFRRPRERNKNLILALGTLIICIQMFITAGDLDLTLLFLLHPPLSFSKSYISYYLGWNNCMIALPLIILLPLFKKIFSINDCFWIVLGMISKSTGCIIFGLSTVKWMIFCVPLVKMFQGFPSAAARSLISLVVESNEQGQLFATVACFEAIVTALATVIFNNLYSATVSINPGISFFVSASVGFLGIGFVCLIWKISDNPTQFEQLVEEKSITEEPVLNENQDC